jgi:hypothetical protein
MNGAAPMRLFTLSSRIQVGKGSLLDAEDPTERNECHDPLKVS